MKIKVIHRVCGREVLVQQILDSNRHCPWDGKPFSVDYTAILAEALQTAEDAGTTLEDALDRMADMHPDFTIDDESLLEPLRDQVDRLRRAPSRVGTT